MDRLREISTLVWTSSFQPIDIGLSAGASLSPTAEPVEPLSSASIRDLRVAIILQCAGRARQRQNADCRQRVICPPYVVRELSAMFAACSGGGDAADDDAMGGFCEAV